MPPEELHFSLPYYSVGFILDKKTSRPIGSGFVFEDPRFVVTARHVFIDSDNNERQLLFQPIRGIGSDEIGPFTVELKPHKVFEKQDIAVLEIVGPPPCKEPLTRGPARSLSTGNLVGFAGFDYRVRGGHTLSISGTPIKNTLKEGGLHFFELEGAAVPGFSGGPLFSGGKEVVGVILRGAPSPGGKTSIFYALSIEDIPSLLTQPKDGQTQHQ